MSWLRTLSRAWTLSNEYSAAWSAGREAFSAGRSLPECVARFAERTDNAVDDLFADELAAALTIAVTYAQQAAHVLGRLAGAIETSSPAVLATADTVLTVLERELPVRLRQARGILDEIERRSPGLQQLAAELGTLAVEASLRLEKLRG